MADARKTPETGSAVCGRGQSVEQPCRYDEAERLRDELIDYIDSTGEEDIDIQKLDELLSRIEKLDPRPENDLYGPQKACEAEAEKQNSAGPDFHSSKRKGPKWPLHKIFSVAAIIAVLLCLLLSQTAFGDKKESEAEWDDEHLRLVNGVKSEDAVIRRRPLEEDETKTYDSVQDMLDDFGIDARIVPTKVPERLGKPVAEAHDSKRGLYLRVDYDGGNEFLSIYYSEFNPNNSNSTEKDYQGANVERIENIQHYIVVDMGITKIIWENGELECHITGNLSYEEMEEVLYSIYED